MEIYLKQGSKIFRFPVLPDSYEKNTGMDNQTENVNRLGEVNLKGKKQLEAINIQSIFPHTAYNFCKYKNILSPSESVDLIDGMEKSGEVQVIMTGSKTINQMFTIDAFNWGEDDATKDINFTLDLKEYRYISRQGSSAPTNYSAVTWYKVVKGDTLQKVSQKCTGTSNNWQKIYKDNNLTSYSLRVGQVLKISI